MGAPALALPTYLLYNLGQVTSLISCFLHCATGIMILRKLARLSNKGWYKRVAPKGKVPSNSHVTVCLCCLFVLLEKPRGAGISDKEVRCKLKCWPPLIYHFGSKQLAAVQTDLVKWENCECKLAVHTIRGDEWEAGAAPSIQRLKQADRPGCLPHCSSQP